MKSARKLLALTLAVLMILTLAACGNEQTDEKGNSEAPRTLTIGTGVEPDTLDPHATTYNYDGGIGTLIYDYLFQFDVNTQQAVPMIAKSFTWADPTTMDIEIRDDVYSSAGTHLTAKDVLFSFQRGADCAGLGNMFGFFDIANSEVTGDYSLRLKLYEPFSNAPYKLTLNCFAVYCEEDFKSVGEEGWAKQPIGTGPYKLESWANGDSAVVVKNDRFWGSSQHFDSITFKYITDMNALMLALQSGDIDIADTLADNLEETLNNTSGIKPYYVDTQQTDCVWFNTTKAPFNDARVIRAMEYAIDKEAMLNTVYLGNYSAGDGFFSTSSIYYEDPENPVTLDVEKAKSLLAEAGYYDGFSFTVIQYPNQSFADMLLIMQNNLKQIGITMNIDTLDFGLFFEKMFDSETMEAYCVGLAGYVPDDGMSLMLAENFNAGNASMYNNPEYEELYLRSKAEMDSAKRAELYKQINDILRENGPFIPLVSHAILNGIKEGLTGFNTTTIGDLIYRDVHYE